MTNEGTLVTPRWTKTSFILFLFHLNVKKNTIPLLWGSTRQIKRFLIEGNFFLLAYSILCVLRKQRANAHNMSKPKGRNHKIEFNWLRIYFEKDGNGVLFMAPDDYVDKKVDQYKFFETN